MFGAVGPFDGYVSTFKPHEHGRDGKPYPELPLPVPEAPPPGTVPSCAEVGVLGAVVGVIGTLQATEVLKEILGIGDEPGRPALDVRRACRALQTIASPGTRTTRSTAAAPTIRDLSIHAGATDGAVCLVS